MNANLRNFALWIIIVLLLLALFTVLQNPGQRTQSTEISFSQLLNEVDKERVKEVVIQGPEIHGTFTDGRQFQTYSPNDPSLVQRLYNKGVAITARPLQNDVPWFLQLLIMAAVHRADRRLDIPVAANARSRRQDAATQVAGLLPERTVA
jgi:cell division protease FtsH